MCVPRRYIVLGLCFLGMFLGRALKTNLDYTLNMNFYLNGVMQMPETPPAIQGWRESMGEYLSAMFFVGFLMTQMLAGYLSTKVPSHFLLGTAMFGICMFNLLLVLVIMQGWFYWACVIRVFMGMAEGFLLPAYFGTLWRWTHRYERGRLGSMVVSGYFLGSLVGFPMSGIVAMYSIWQAPYLFFSAAGLIWVVAWAFLGSERPETDPNITDKELEHLREESRYDIYAGRKLVIPWAKIFTSKHILVLFFCNFTFYLCYTNEPRYVQAFGRLGFSYYYRVLCTCLPQLALVIVAYLGGYISDALIKTGRLSITNVRKIFTCSGFGVTSFCFLVLSFLRNPTAILVFLVIGIGFSGLTTSGWQINHLDLAPKYCGLLVGISGSFGAFSSLIVLFVSYVAPRFTLASIGFFPIVSVVTALAALLYYFLGSGEVEEWCDDSNNKSPNKITVVMPTMQHLPVISGTGGKPDEGVPVQMFYKEWPFHGNGKHPLEDSGNDTEDDKEEEEEYDDTKSLLDMCERIP